MVGVTVVSVTVTVPPDSAMTNGLASRPLTGTLPVNVSTVGFTGVVGIEVAFAVGSSV